MMLNFHHAEEIARKGKTRNVPAAIAHVLAQPNHTAHDLVGVSGGIALREDRLVPSDARSRRDVLQGADAQRANEAVGELFVAETPARPQGLTPTVVIPRRELFDAAYSSLESDFRRTLERCAARLVVPADAVR